MSPRSEIYNLLNKTSNLCNTYRSHFMLKLLDIKTIIQQDGWAKKNYPNKIA